MNRASFIALMMFWSSLPIMVKLVDGTFMTLGVAMVMNWRGGLLMIFEPLC